MSRMLFSTVILAFAILAFVQAGPVSKNQEGKDVSARLNESTLDYQFGKFESELEGTWVNVKNTIDKNYNELLDDSSVSRPFLNTLNGLIEEINKVNAGIIDNAREQVDNFLKPNGKAETNVNNVKDYVLDSWNAYQDRLWEQYEKSMENPKIQAIVREVENAMRTSKDILEGFVDATRVQIDSERSENMDVVVEFEDDDLQRPWSSKTQEAWKQLKKQLKEKYDKLVNNPKVKEIADNVDKAFDKFKESLKNIVNSIGKDTVVRDSRSYSLEETQKAQVADLKERAERVRKDLERNLKEKTEAIRSNPKVKEVVEKGEQPVEQDEAAKKTSKNVIENVRNEIDQISKETEELEEYTERTSVKERIEEIWNVFKMIITDKFDEIIRDPKTKDYIDKSEKMINDIQENIKNIIESIRKAAKDSLKDTDEKSARSAADTYLRNVQEGWKVFEKKIMTTYQNVWENKKVKTAITSGRSILSRVKNNIDDIVDSIREEVQDKKINSL